MRNFWEKLIPLGFAAILAFSFLNLDAAKYDTADRIWLSLALGALILLPPLLLGFRGVKKYPILSLTLGGFCVFVWISWIFSQTKNYGFTEAVVYSVAALFGISLTTVKNKTRDSLLNIALIFAVASALYGFWYFPTHGEARMAGLFLDAKDPRHFFPNAFANFLLMAWPLILRKQETGSPKAMKQGVTILVLSIVVAALYLTYSRGAWAVFFIQIILLLIFSWRKIGKTLLLAAGLTVLFILLLGNLRLKNFSNISVSEKISFQNIEQRTSFEERKDFWTGSLKLIAQEPLKGFGPMSFRYAYPSVQKKFLGLSDHPHNWLFKIGVENGLPTAAFFITFLIIIFAQSRKLPITNYQLPISLAFLGGLLHNMLDYNMNFISTIALFFLLASALLASKKEAHREWLSKFSLIVWMLLASGVTVVSIHAIQNKNAYIPREYFRNEAKNFDRHLLKNPLDAYAWYLKGDAERALELDPMNQFAYYRKVLEEDTGYRIEDTVKETGKQEIVEKVRMLLQEYEGLLTNNVHYTAFTDNPEEAAKIYEIFGERKKAREIREKTARIRKEFTEKQHFGKQLAPRTFW